MSVEKWSNIHLKFCGVNTERFVKYVWPFFNIMHERANRFYTSWKYVETMYQVFLLLISFADM